MSDERISAVFTWLVVATLVTLVTAVGMGEQKGDQSILRRQRTLALARSEVRQLLLLMDTDRSGKVSRQEFMNFMQAECDRLDKDKSGELDVRELAQAQVRPSRAAAGK
jgi:hypothetical protein